ncbi:unnamed protein product [Rotaria sordida]|uniref:Uncharacterized protein n=1 Tax=Rotaria sordida TaxID=392033 RepID=A0A815QBW3_9BILA|nr:unnamed protein product [Rotaria sordida]
MTGQFSLIATISDSLIHSISWLDQRHFLSIANDSKRLPHEKLIDILETKENLTIDSKELLIILNNFHNDRIIIENSLNEYQVQREMLCLRTGCEAYKETAKYLSQLYILLRDSNIELKISIKWLI